MVKLRANSLWTCSASSRSLNVLVGSIVQGREQSSARRIFLNRIELFAMGGVIYFVKQSMKILLINPPHPSIGSRIPREHLPPLGLLALGGPLLDAGHEVKLLDGEFGPKSLAEIIGETLAFRPEAVLLGHSGSTSGHPSAVRIMRAIRQALPEVWIIYGGVFPTYHYSQVMAQ